MFSYLIKRWSSPCGYRDLLKIALPLIFSMGSVAIQQFLDRMFLTWYSQEAIAAVAPAGLLSFTFVCIVMGTVTYASAFVAQYFGAKNLKRIGPAVWQGIYISIAGGIMLMGLYPAAGSIFSFFGHSPEVQKYETIYFRIMCFGATPSLAATAISCFFTGRGKTWTVMWVNIFATTVNGILDYVMIFGKFGFPEMGVAGAAYATVCSFFVSFIILLFLFLNSANDKEFNTRTSWKIEWPLLRRILRFGFPSGVHFFLDIAGFTIFIFILGRLGTVYLAASNIAFNINTIAFMPMIGVGTAVSILVGQHLGNNDVKKAGDITISGYHIAFTYMGLIALSYILIPNVYLYPYEIKSTFENFKQIKDITIILLKFVAVYSFFDSCYMIFSSAIKGAGDTHFVMKTIGLSSVFVLVIPSYIAVTYLHRGIYTVWTIGSIYIISLGLISFFRYKTGKWKSMRVIENIPPQVPRNIPEIPIIDGEL